MKLTILSIENKILAKFECENIINTFTSKNARRMDFVGYYYPTLEIVGVSNEHIRPWTILIS
jgi:hypothetical protein